jgi:hypothetical protein
MIPCFGFVSLPLSGLGLLLGIAGLIVAIFRKGHGLGFPIAGAAICGMALAIGAAWLVMVGGLREAAKSTLDETLEESKVTRAKIDCEALSMMVETYKLNNGDYPHSIERLAAPQPNGAPALCPPDKIKDPWGKHYQLDTARGGGRKARVFTTTPEGETVANQP